MSENSTPEERTELPTEKRWSKIKNDGQLPLSNEFNQVLVLMFSFSVLVAISGSLWKTTAGFMVLCFRKIGEKEPLNYGFLQTIFTDVFISYVPSLGLLIVSSALAGILVTIIQTKGNVKEKWVKFKWSFLNPIQGFGRIVSYQGAVGVIKALLKLSLLLPVGFYTLWGLIPETISLLSVDLGQILAFTARGLDNIFWNLISVLLLLGIIDFFYTRYTFFRQNKMTKDEVKDERKSIEGDEATKRKIRAKALDRAWQKMAIAVPKADVIIINPTHYAIALKYDRTTMVAPEVVAKGKGHMALRIREIARENKIPMVQRRMLARSLYASVKVGGQIPFELFRVVAEVLAYIYKIKSKR
jgi:flagellar biosynthesis protein FlhB